MVNILQLPRAFFCTTIPDTPFLPPSLLLYRFIFPCINTSILQRCCGTMDAKAEPVISPGTNEDRKKQSVRFKAAHALLVAFFLLIL